VTSGFGGYSSTMMAPKPAPQNQSEVIDLDYSELPLAFSPAKPAKPGSFALAGRAKKVVNQSFHWKKRCPWTDELHNANRNVFGNLSFRSQQEEAINAVMSGKDVFVLMPTGGGKSLCYQLPSILGDGVTVVVSPLVSLIQDQVQHLRKLGINAAAMVASQTADERSEVMSDLRSMNPQTRLVYVTPEKVSRSPAFFSVLQRLYDNRKLARIAIDEAHCVSQWGHDFRPDYKELSIFRRRFPNTPVMALTATATPEVQNDVLLQLGLKPAPSSIMFVQSFNRSNLIYEVRQKTKNSVVKNIGEEIEKRFKGQSGIVYCLSQKDCEEVAEKLRKEFNMNARPYHAGLNEAVRTENQLAWSRGAYNVICATIAFGMGIDKPDVRFVYHHSLPKNIEGYYQESGRAGRDGRISYCILYFSNGDRFRWSALLGKDKTVRRDQLAFKEEALSRMASYCLNDVECRRTQLLAHFAEHFEASECHGKCDNCKKGVAHTIADMSEQAVQLGNSCIALRDQYGYDPTAVYLMDFYRGKRGKMKPGHWDVEGFGQGVTLKENIVFRLIEGLIARHMLKINIEIGHFGQVVSSLEPIRSKLSELTRPGGKFEMAVSSSINVTPKKPSGKAARVVHNDGEFISRPQAPSDGEPSDEEGPSTSRPKRKAGSKKAIMPPHKRAKWLQSKKYKNKR